MLAVGGAAVLAVVIGLLKISKVEVDAKRKGGPNDDPLNLDDLDGEGESVFDHLKESTEAELKYDYRASLRALEKAYDTAPENPTVMFKLGKVLSHLGETERAIGFFKDLIQSNPNDIKPHLELAKLHTKQGNFTEAERFADSAIKVDPNHESALKMQALVLTKKDDPEASKEVFQKLMTQFPQNPAYQKQYAQQLKRQKRWEEALQFYGELATQHPANRTEYDLECALIHFESRDFEQSVEKFRAVLESNGANALEERDGLKESYAASLSNMGAQLQTRGDLDQAEHLYREALNYDDKNPDIFFNYGKILVDTNKLAEAKEYFGKAIDVNPNDSESLYEMGRIYDKSNDLDQALDFYQRCLAANSQFGQAAFGVGTIYGVMGELEKSVEYLKKTINLEPSNVDAVYNLAVCYERMDEKNKAVKLYRKVLQMDNKHEDARNNLLNLKTELGIS